MARKASKTGPGNTAGAAAVHGPAVLKDEPARFSWLGDPFNWALVLFPIIGFLLYSGSLDGPFIFDDTSNIVTNIKIHLYKLDFKKLMEAATSEPSTRRVLPNISFALNHYLGGLHTRGYHVVNVMVHVATSIILYIFMSLTLRTPAMKENGQSAKWTPLAASLLFLVHPLATNVASYIVQRMASMAAMFYLASFACYVKARLSEKRGEKAGLFIASLLFFGCSLASKQNAATLPALMALYEWFFFRDLSAGWFLKKLPYLAGVIVLLIIAGLYYTNFDPGRLLTMPYEFRDFTLGQRLFTQFRVVVLYITLILLPLPSRLNLDWDFPKSMGFFSPPSTFVSMLIIAALIVWAFAGAKRHRLHSFCVFWFFGNLLIESSFLPLEMVFEHRTYLPSMAFCMAAAYFILKNVKPMSLAAAALAVICLFFSAFTFERNKVWADDLALWQDVVKKAPGKARPNFNLCASLTAHGRPEEAIGYCRKGLEIKPNESNGYFNLALALENPRIKRYDEALACYRKTVELNPRHALALANIAHVLVQKGRIAFKKDDRKTALDDFSQALTHIQSAVEIGKDNPSIWLNTGRSLLMMGNSGASIPYFEKALALDPGFAKAHNNLGIAFSSMGDFKQAARHLEASLALFPEDSVTMFNLGLTLEKMGRADLAVNYYRKVARSRAMAPEQMDAVEGAQKALARLTTPKT